MSDDPSHRAMLYFLEILMNSNGPVSIGQLAGRFGSKNFTQEMRDAAGSNEIGLKRFLQKFPSLFHVHGNMVTLGMGESLGGMSPTSPGVRTGVTAAATPTSVSAPTTPAIDTPRSKSFKMETEAVQYFQRSLGRREEKWVSIKSLAGHLSQAHSDVREIVGPQANFRAFLVSHPYVFDVQGEMVSLKDDLRSNSLAKGGHAASGNRKAPYQKPGLGRKKSSHATIPPPQPPSKQGPITMTANEYKAITFLKQILESSGPTRVGALLPHFERAAESVQNSVGQSTKDLEDFILDHPIIFELDEDKIASVKKHGRLNVIITGSRPKTPPQPTCSGRKGPVCHVAKLWCILDMGNHEHVFVDRQMMETKPEDVRKVVNIGDVFYFEGEQAPKGSRATWRATKIWRAEEDDPLSGIGSTHDNSVASSIRDLEKELDRFDVADDLHADYPEDPFADAPPSGAGVIAVWNLKQRAVAARHDIGTPDAELPVLEGAEQLQDMLQIDVIPESKFLSMNVDTDSTYVARLGVPSIVPEEFLRVSSTMSSPGKHKTANGKSASAETTDKKEEKEVQDNGHAENGQASEPEAPPTVFPRPSTLGGGGGDTPGSSRRPPAPLVASPSPVTLTDVASAARTSLTSGILAGKVAQARQQQEGKMATTEVACQTVSTGDIIATQLYYD